jgi:NAD(P)-dependent dehydrogenase (short-subunit alcohol dehydrogenase family)
LFDFYNKWIEMRKRRASGVATFVSMNNTQTPVWFITGCSTGLGRELAKLVLEKGWRAVVTARRLDTIRDLTKGHEDRALALALDVTDRGRVWAAVAQAEDHFGQIDVLVNNAGYGYLTSIEEGEESKIRAQMETNFFGIVNTIQAALPGMRRRRQGHIVNYSSIGGLVGFAASGYYHASKFALEGFSEALSVEVAPLGIKVLIVEPGPFRTDWAGRSIVATPVVLDEYKEVVGGRMTATSARSGNQAGDPVRGGDCVIQAVTTDYPYQRLLLGKMAYEIACGKVDKMKQNFEGAKHLTFSADFPEGGLVTPDLEAILQATR